MKQLSAHNSFVKIFGGIIICSALRIQHIFTFFKTQINVKRGNCSRPEVYEGIQALSENNLSHTNEFTINDELMTSVAITHQGNERSDTIAIIGTDKGSIRKVKLLKRLSVLRSIDKRLKIRNNDC